MMVHMKSVSALELRKHVGQLLDEAAGGERIIIERGGQPLCALVPLRDLEDVDPGQKLRRQMHAIDELQRLARQHPFPEGFDAAEAIREGRRERDEQIMRAVNAARDRRGST
jgi:antitoxin (DNA-binding transcriptional repressor) of toxin-antitoxin stability system